MRKMILLLFFLINNLYAQTEQTITLSVDRAEEIALQNNPEYQFQLKKVEAQRGIYWSEMMPDNLEIGVEIEEIPTGQSSSSYGERRLFITQLIDFPTNYYFRHQVLKAEIEREMLQLELVKRDLSFNVKEAYWNLVLQNELVWLAQQNLELSRDFFEKSKRCYELGETDRLTMLKAKVNLGGAQKKLQAARMDVETAVSALKSILGIKPHELGQLVLIDSLPEIITIFSRDQFRQDLQNNPALIMAQISKKAAVNAKHLAFGNLLPQVSLSYFKQEIDKNDFWGGELSLSVPLWFMKQKGLIQQRKAEQNMANYFHIAEQLRLQREFEQTVTQLKKAANEVRLFQTELLEEAEEIFRIA